FYIDDKSYTNNIVSNDELFKLDLNAHLAVLSACETGVGKFYRGEGTYSIARAFSYSGTPTLLTSLWKIKSQSNIGIMESFYKQVDEEIKLDKALRVSKIGYMLKSDEITSHPVYWASLVLVGDTQEIVLVKYPHLFLKLISIFTAFVFMVLLLIKHQHLIRKFLVFNCFRDVS
ncbi:MAG: CHAT domain-containing protein, partial [Bacteroidales bacterium]|nr:CHAT domain-containing protein [Bacteroidales bacterium]